MTDNGMRQCDRSPPKEQLTIPPHVIDACEDALHNFGVVGGIAKGAAEGIARRVIEAYNASREDKDFIP